MKKLLYIFILILCLDVRGDEENEGPSSLEGEFLKQSNIHLPINYSPLNGVSATGLIKQENSEDAEDDLYGDIIGLSISITPIAYASWENVTRLINLEESISNSNSIEESDSTSPYLLIENKRWDLGLGFEASLNLPSPIGLGAGVAFLKGSNYFSIRSLTNKYESRAPLKLPTSQENLKNWRVGDQIFYASRGGVIFNLFLGFKPIITLGPEYIHSGSYRIRANLVSSDLMEIEITVTKTDSVGLEGITLPFKFELSKGKGLVDSMVYEFDLKNPGSVKAMDHLFNGRVDLTNQEMLLSGGKIKLNTKIQHTYVSISGKYGIPYLHSTIGTLGISQSNGTVEKEEDGSLHKLEVFSNSTNKNYVTRGILSDRRWYNQSVASTVLRDSEANASVITSFFSWSFSKDHMSAKLLRKKLSKLARIFGINKLRNLNFPVKKMGYLKADFSINLSGSDVLHLLDTAKLRDIGEDALAQLDQDFKLYGHRAFCKIRRYNDCFNRHYQQIERKFETIKDLVLSLEKSYQQDRIGEVSKKLTEIVNQLFTSKFLTQSFVKARTDLMFELRLEGENIKKHTLKL